MSAFDDVTARFSEQVAILQLRPQVALFAVAAEVLTPRYLDWVTAADSMVLSEIRLLDRAVAEAKKFAASESSTVSRGLLQALEAAVPADRSDADWFTAAQDCWICADTALRVSLGEFAAEDSTWYLLEPVFQCTSERLFGYTDVGSELEALESVALEDAALRRAVAGLDTAIDVLRGSPVDRSVLARVRKELDALTP